MRHRPLRSLVATLTVMASASCTARPVRVGLAFDNDWRIGREVLTAPEQAGVRAAALRTMRQAFRGFDVTVREARDADRVVIVDKGYVAGLVPRGQPAPVGETLPFAVVSRVHFEEIAATLLAVVGCAELGGGCTKTRSELVEGLGQGIGATAAHELGHQVGFRFAVDAPCDVCYDGHTAKTYDHFFGTPHWSDGAMSTMRRVLPTGSR